MVKSLLDNHLQSLHRTCSSQQDASSSLFTCDVQTLVHLNRGYYGGVVSIGRKHPIMRIEQVLLAEWVWAGLWLWWWCWHYDANADKAQSPHRSSRWTLIQVHVLLLEPLGNQLDTPPSPQSEEIWEFIFLNQLLVKVCSCLSNLGNFNCRTSPISMMLEVTSALKMIPEGSFLHSSWPRRAGAREVHGWEKNSLLKIWISSDVIANVH